MKEQDYQNKLEWLFRQLPMFSRVGAAAYKPGLDRSLRLAEHFDNPQNNFKSIHIAGTNGKGSTANLIAATLQAAGYRVALYTSPHLVDFRERIRINGDMIPKDDVARFIDEWRRQESQWSDKPSFFELTMMMAFDWFARQKVDYAVIEVGMGGRLDSTNIITPILSVITNISFDHTQFLGNTLAAIAAEKAGIIKQGIPVVIGEAEGDVQQVFRSKAIEMNAPLREAYNEIDEAANAALPSSLHGDYQKKNINTARVAIDQLRHQGIVISDDAEKRGFADVEKLTGFMGRWSVMNQNPLMICDTGHNEGGLRYNMAQLLRLRTERPGCRLHIVLGFVADKDVDHIMPFFPSDAIYYLTRAQIPRALAVEALAEKAENVGWIHSEFPSVADAVAAALAAANPRDIIYIGGSTFIVADFLASRF